VHYASFSFIDQWLAPFVGEADASRGHKLGDLGSWLSLGLEQVIKVSMAIAAERIL